MLKKSCPFKKKMPSKLHNCYNLKLLLNQLKTQRNLPLQACSIKELNQSQFQLKNLFNLYLYCK